MQRPLGIPRSEQPIVLEVDRRNAKTRLIFVISFILLAAISFAVAMGLISHRSAGWAEVTADDGRNGISSGFVLYYLLGDADMSATKEYKAVRRCYTEACLEASAAFDPSSEHGGRGGNLATLNGNPNTKVSISPGLYSALELIRDSGSRDLYLGPVYYDYWLLVNSTADETAALYDPSRSDAAADFCARAASFAADSGKIDIELYPDCQAVLRVSEDYLAFARDWGVSEFVSLGWMRNAFAADLIAERLVSEGFTNGVLSSLDGSSRSLGVDAVLTRPVTGLAPAGESGTERPVTLAELSYGGLTRKAAVSVSTLPSSAAAAGGSRSYVYSNGEAVNSYVCSGTGRCASDFGTVLCCSDTDGCAVLALKLSSALGRLPARAAQERTSLAAELTYAGIGSFVYPFGLEVVYSDPGATFVSLYSDGKRTAEPSLFSDIPVR